MSDVAIPPYDLNVEGALLCAILREPERAWQVTGLRPEMFFSHSHALIYGAIEALRSARQMPSRELVLSHLESHRKLDGEMQVGGAAYVDAIHATFPWLRDLEGHAKIIRDKWRVRALITRLATYSARAYEAPGDGADIFRDVVDDVSSLALSGVEAKSLKYEDELIDEYMADIRARVGGEANTVLTGIYGVDRVIGSMRGGELFILAARPGLGKTTFAIQVAANMRARHDARGVLFFSYEMKGRELIQRYVSTLSGVPMARIDGVTGDPVDVERIRRVAKDAREQRTFVVEENDMTDLPRMQARIRQVAHAFASRNSRLGLVIVDYLQLAADPNPSRSRERDVAKVSRALKSFAKEFNVPVLALAQMNRGVDAPGAPGKKPNKRAPRLSDLRESGAIEQDADMVWFLARNDTDRETGHETAEVCALIVAKNRRGPRPRVPVAFELQCARFRDATEDEARVMPKFDD